MSIDLMAAIWNNGDPELSGSKLNVMLCLADRANQDNECWPSMADISRRCRISQRNVVYVLQDLEKLGYITVDRTTGKANHYKLRATRPTSEASFTGENDDTSEAEFTPPVKRTSLPPVKPIAHKSSVEPSRESSVVQTESDDDEAVPTKPRPEPPPVKALTPQQAMIGAVADACGMDLAIKSHASRCGKIASELIKAKYTPDSVANFKRWWVSDNWRKEHAPVPTIQQLTEKIAQGATYQNGRASPPVPAKSDLAESPAEIRMRELRQRQGGGVREA